LMHEGNVERLRSRAAEIASKRIAGRDLHEVFDGRGSGEKERAREGEGLIARSVRERPDLDRDEENSGLMQELMNPVYRLWIFEQVKADGRITVSDAIHAGSEHVVDQT